MGREPSAMTEVMLKWDKGLAPLELEKLEATWRLFQKAPGRTPRQKWVWVLSQLKVAPEFEKEHPVYGEFEHSRYVVAVERNLWSHG